MPLLANPRHEAFAQNRAAGLQQLDSYVNAGFEGNPSAASQLEKRPEVKARIAEIIAERQERRRQDERETDTSVSDLDRDWILRNLKQNVVTAQASGQISAANKSIELLMDLLNLTPKKGAPPPEEESNDKHAPVTDDKLGRALDKLDQMTSFENLPE